MQDVTVRVKDVTYISLRRFFTVMHISETLYAKLYSKCQDFVRQVLRYMYNTVTLQLCTQPQPDSLFCAKEDIHYVDKFSCGQIFADAQNDLFSRGLKIGHFAWIICR